MGKGGAQLGKPVKGRSKEKKDKKVDAVDKQLADDLKMLEEYERLNKLADLQRERLKKLHQQEVLNTKINQKILLTIYRKFMRQEKVASLRREVEILAQNHAHDLSRKDALIQVLLRDLTAAEAQLLTARRGHVMVLDKLLRLQEEKLSSVSSEFDRDVRALCVEYREEMEEVVAAHTRSVAEVTEVLHLSSEADKERSSAAKTAHESERERVRNSNLESLNELRITLENRIDDLERLFAEAHAAYLEQTHEKSQLFRELQQQDKVQTRRLRVRNRALAKAVRELALWRHKTRVLQGACAQRHGALKAQINVVSQQCLWLKGLTAQSRRGEEHRLCEVALRGREAVQRASEQVESGAQLLQLGELCRKLETERERVLPHDSSVVSVLAQTRAAQQGDVELATAPQAEREEAEARASAGANTTGEEEVDWKRLDVLFRSIGKVRLESAAIGQERARLEQEKAQLESVLQQYLAGVAVREDALNSANPLLVVNGRVGVNGAATVRAGLGQPPQQKVVIEAAVAVRRGM